MYVLLFLLTFMPAYVLVLLLLRRVLLFILFMVPLFDASGLLTMRKNAVNGENAVWK
jgi:hypothetical protein